MSVLWIDTETLGLSLERHPIWQIAYAFDDEPVQSHTVLHEALHADPEALELNGYHERGGGEVDPASSLVFERALIERIEGVKPVLAGANPSFDAYRLSRRWGVEEWHHRLLDVCLFAAPLLGWDSQKSLLKTAQALAEMGYDVPEPTHDAADDVEAARAVYRASLELQATQMGVLCDSGVFT